MRTFSDVTDIIRLKNYYREFFKSRAGKAVLRDLAKVCHATTTTYNEDPREHAVAEGRRQIWLRIQNMINIPDAEIYELQQGED